MRTLAIGDIHGCLRALEILAQTVQFKSDDLVITLGDYIDRGPDSRGVIEFLLGLSEKCRLVHLGGNHEIMMLKSRHSKDLLSSWLGFGGDITLRSYGGRFEDVPQTHWDFIGSGGAYYETEDHIFVHANLEPDKPMIEQNPEILLWEPLWKPETHMSGKTMICGHTAQKSGRPKNYGNAVCIDTHVYGKDGWLTCLDVNTDIYWQANQKGQQRRGLLEREEKRA